jgi:hypothetical protein
VTGATEAGGEVVAHLENRNIINKKSQMDNGFMTSSSLAEGLTIKALQFLATNLSVVA